MNCSACHEKRDDYVDGALSAAAARELEAHLAHCPACATEIAALRRLRAATTALPREIAPPRDLWLDIATQLRAPAADRAENSSPPRGQLLHFPAPARRGGTRFIFQAAVAAAIAVLMATLAPRHALRAGARAWPVAPIAGAPKIGTRPIAAETPLRVGQWLETDAASRAKLSVGSIGVVDIAPNSRVRLVETAPTDHRIELARGTLHAVIWAPPRLFFVETRAATAVDLGCAYTMNVADDGRGELRVTSGYVALEHGGRESIVPAPAHCLTRTGAGPGTPFADDAAPEFRAALERFDFVPGAATPALAVLLAHPRAEDALTFWHLLARVAPAERGRVFDALATVHPAPEGVTRAGIVAGDAAMRRAWAVGLGFGALLKN